MTGPAPGAHVRGETRVAGTQSAVTTVPRLLLGPQVAWARPRGLCCALGGGGLLRPSAPECVAVCTSQTGHTGRVGTATRGSEAKGASPKKCRDVRDEPKVCSPPLRRPCGNGPAPKPGSLGERVCVGARGRGAGAASPHHYRDQGNPCTTIRWGVSPAAQMGCLRNRSGSPSGQGLALIFIPAGGGGGSPLDPLPPSPLSSSAPENLGFGNTF